MKEIPEVYKKSIYRIEIKNVSVIEMTALEAKIESLNYESHDFILCVLGNYKYIYKNNKYDFMLLIHREKMLSDKKLKEVLLEYII